MCQNILIGVDGSEDSYKAVRTGIEIAKRFSAKITFLYVATDEYIKKRYGGASGIAQSLTQVDDILLDQSRTREIGEAFFEKITKLAEDHLGKNNFATKLVSGHPSEVFLNELLMNKYDLIILGRKGASKAQKVVFGSLIESIINQTNVPCLIAGNGDEKPR